MQQREGTGARRDGKVLIVEYGDQTAYRSEASSGHTASRFFLE
jgi:hypothetical protein